MRKTILGLFGLLLLSPAVLVAQQTPLAAGQQKFLGSAYSAAQAKDFDRYWNKLTPENAGKWGSVEPVRGQFDWAPLDDAYRFAKSHGMLFHLHVLVWGRQQPKWMLHLPPEQQRKEIEKWMDAAAARYPGADFVEVVNEPLHHPPSTRYKDGGNYLKALGGRGATGWDWVITAFRMARVRFPHAKLLMNDYGILNSAKATARYRSIVELLQREHLIDGIGVQAHAFVTHGVPAATLQANLDTLAATGVPVYVTEMDIDGRNDAVQLREYQRVFPIFWNDSAVKGITLWGFRPGLWRDKEGAYLIRKDGSERPALAWLRDYVRAKRPAATP